MDQGLASRIKARARELGFALCGIAEARASDHAEHVRQWLDAGQHGQMAWLAEHLDERLDPARLLPGARSVVCVADFVGYPAGSGPNREEEARSEATGRVGRYAQFDDYHKVLKRRLMTLADEIREMGLGSQTKVCVDTAPVLEREHAMRAGIGWMGKNTLTIHPQLGSHLLLGEIITTLELAVDEAEPNHCGNCTRCIDACPTGCITPYAIDARRCISYLTIEHRGVIDAGLHEAMGEWLYGCDVCQDVCPFNARLSPAAVEAGEARTPAEYGGGRPDRMGLLDVLGWDEAARQTAFIRSPMKRAKLDQMKRNALIVAGNVLRQREDAGLRGRIEAIANDDSEPILARETARQVLRSFKL